jgi:FixJ family two-component response regulator
VTAIAEAVRDARVFDPDALLCELPADPGRIKALVDELQGQGLGLPALAMAGATDAAACAAGRSAGFVDVLAGPVTFSDLAEAIRHAIGR